MFVMQCTEDTEHAQVYKVSFCCAMHALQSVVIPWYIVVLPSVRPSVCDIRVGRYHRI